MVVTFYLTKRCWLGFARLHYVTNSSSRLANTAVFSPGCSPKSCAFYSFCDYPSANCNELTVTFAHALQLHFTKGKALLCQEPTFCHILILYLSGVHRNFPWGVHSVAYGGHLYLVCYVCDVIVMFPNQRFGEVCWHNMHIRRHALPLIYMSLNWI